MGKRNTSFILIIAVIIVLGFISNPNRGEHQTAIENHVTQTISQNKQSDGTIGDELGFMIQRQFLSGLIGNRLQVKNYGLISIGKIQGKTLTVGVFGQVFMTKELKTVETEDGESKPRFE